MLRTTLRGRPLFFGIGFAKLYVKVSLVVNTRVMVHPAVACEGHSRMFSLKLGGFE